MIPREDLFVDGPVDPATGSTAAERWRDDPAVGGVAWFYGQVRGDTIAAGTVTAIEYTAYRPLADRELAAVIAETLERDGIAGIFLCHSLGIVPVGGTAMVVGIAGGHRGEVFGTLPWIVDEIKRRVPIYGKELTDADSYRWKVNT
jgi:molybdopterin synthase catalytic subunit